jgi:hypothetical protein
VDQRVPFIGPRPFAEVDAELFFGRENELAALSAEVVSVQIVLLYAPSGSGKSSLINAGLTPAMRGEGFEVSQVRLNTLAPSNGQTRVGALSEAIRDSALASSAERPSLLILDQFEEIVVALTYAELGALAETMSKLMAENSLARIVLSFREEYLARINVLFGKTTETSVGNFRLDRLSKPGAAEAFQRSLDTVGFQVEREAEELFLEKLTPPTRRLRSEVALEPLYFQLLGSQLWSSIESRGPMRAPDGNGTLNDAGPIVTAADIRSLVDFDQAIEIFYNSTISRVCAARRVSEKTARDWIDRELVTPDETRSMVRRQADETEGLPTKVLDDLVRDGLLRTEPRGDDLWIELAHDQLVERVREFNRVWWTGRVYGMLLNRDDRFSIAMDASRADVSKWAASRMYLSSTVSGLRESGIQLSRWTGRWIPFMRASNREIDRLPLRAFMVAGTLVNSAIYLYRSQTAPSVPQVINEVDGLDLETAKRKLQATALNLGRTDQVLAAANLCVTLSWARVLFRLQPGSGIGTAQHRRRRIYAGILISADAGLSLLRWAVRRGLIWNCLDHAQPFPLARAEEGAKADMVRRCTSLEEAASWSQENPVLLVVDWRADMDGTTEFERFINRELPFHENALKVRGAVVAWCCRADVRRRGWRDAVSGIGFPWRGQRAYYMVERGHVVAWRTVKSYELPMRAQAGVAEEQDGSSPVVTQQAEVERRFRAILAMLIVSGEAAPSYWRDLGEQFANNWFGRRRSERIPSR